MTNVVTSEKNRTRKLSRRNTIIAVIAALLVVGIGYTLVLTKAAGFFASVSPSTATLSGNAKVVTESDGSKALQFTAPVTTPPTNPPTNPPTTPPAPGDKPTATNTGVLPGSNLRTHNGNYSVTTDGATIADMNITGNLYLVANNITVKNVKVGGFLRINNTEGGVQPFPVKKNMKISNVDIRTMDAEGLENVTIDKALVRGQGDSASAQLKLNNDDGKMRACNGLTLTNSYFAEPPAAKNSSTHRESFHPMGCTNMVVRNNVFDMTSPSGSLSRQVTTAAVHVEVFRGVYNENVVYDGNYHYGGGYFQVYLNFKNGTVTNNKFHSYPGGDVEYPPRSYPTTYYPFQQSGNTLDGKPFTFYNKK